jgi:hypothetical protein
VRDVPFKLGIAAARLLTLLLLAPMAVGADMQAGKAKVQPVCAACHGASGVSVSDAIPNLGGQKPAYLELQLKALKDGSRKNPLMNSIASHPGFHPGYGLCRASYFRGLARTSGAPPGRQPAGRTGRAACTLARPFEDDPAARSE